MELLLVVLGMAVVVAIIGFRIKNRKEKAVIPTDKSIKQPYPHQGGDQKDEAIKKYKASQNK